MVSDERIAIRVEMWNDDENFERGLKLVSVLLLWLLVLLFL